MTPAILFLEKHQAHFIVHHYDCTAHDDFGAHAAAQLNAPLGQVFKTLLTAGEQGAIVALVPASQQLNLKRLAKAAGVKKLAMMKPEQAERLTGYKVGGISPLAQKKRLPSVIDISANQYPHILVSGGKRGLSLAITANTLQQLLGAVIADIAK